MVFRMTSGLRFARVRLRFGDGELGISGGSWIYRLSLGLFGLLIVASNIGLGLYVRRLGWGWPGFIAVPLAVGIVVVAAYRIRGKALWQPEPRRDRREKRRLQLAENIFLAMVAIASLAFVIPARPSQARILVEMPRSWGRPDCRYPFEISIRNRALIIAYNQTPPGVRPYKTIATIVWVEGDQLISHENRRDGRPAIAAKFIYSTNGVEKWLQWDDGSGAGAERYNPC